MIALALALLAGYLAGWLWQRRRGNDWPLLRLASFVLGCAVLLLALRPSLSLWAHLDLRVHAVQHLLLGMFAPLALALGAPGLLLLRCLPARQAKALTGLLGSRPLRGLTHPISALLLDLGALYLLYLTPLFSAVHGSALAHGWLHLHFLIAGYLFAWAIAGPDPAPHRPGMVLRLGVLFVGIAGHALLAKLMYGFGFPRGTAYPLEQIEAAAQLMHYGGSLAELLLASALFTAWYRQRQRRWASEVPAVT